MTKNRFTLEKETVQDNASGLVWPKDGALSEFPLAWEEALAFVREMNDDALFGYDHWKLPNRKELFSLVSREAINPSLPPGNPFVNVFHGYYWTSTSCARLPDQAWYVHMGGARVFKGMKANSYMVWPVCVSDTPGSRLLQTGQVHCSDTGGKPLPCRGTGQDGAFRSGLAAPVPRFQADGDTVLDRATGLVWLRNADAGGGMVDWHSAWELADRMNKERRHGFADWRVPAIEELESLTDMDRHSPALPSVHPFVNVRDFYWSATTSLYDTTYAWTLYMKDGAVGVGYKDLTEFYLWPVRGCVTGTRWSGRPRR